MGSASEPIRSHWLRNSLLGAVVLVFIWMLTGCWIPYRRTMAGLSVDYDGRDLVALVEVESGYRTWNPIDEALQHGGPRWSIAGRVVDHVLLRWDAQDGHLLAIEPFATGDSDRVVVRGVAPDALLVDREVHQRHSGTWRQTNAGQKPSHWMGEQDFPTTLSLDHRWHLHLRPGRVEIRSTLTGDIHAERPRDVTWERFISHVDTRSLSTSVIDGDGWRLLMLAHRQDGNRQERVVSFDLRDGSIRSVPIDARFLEPERPGLVTLIEAMDLVDGELQVLIGGFDSNQPGTDKTLRRIVTGQGAVIYDNAWQHDFPQDTTWRPREKLLLLSECTGGYLPDKQMRVIRIDYGRNQENAFTLPYPTEAEVLPYRPSKR